MADPTDVPFAEAGENPEDLWAALSESGNGEVRSALRARIEAELARCAAALADPALAAQRRSIQEHSDQVYRVGRALSKMDFGDPGDSRSPAVRRLDSLAGARRERTNADRAAFVLSEATELAAAAALGGHRGEPPAPPAPEPAALELPPSVAEARSRRLLREAREAARRAGFVRFLGEVTFRALPLDEHEKSPHRRHVLEEAAEAAASAAPWALLPAAEAAIEEVSLAVGDCSDAAEAERIVSEACADPASALGRMVEAAGSEVEGRAVAAMAGARRRAAALERAVALSEATAGSDEEMRRLRVKREQDRARPTLIESLFVANRAALSEAAGSDEVPSGLVLTESVCQYAMLEALSSYGVLQISGDPEPLIKALARSANRAA